MRKRSKFIKDAVAEEARKSYKPPAIVDAVQKDITKVHENAGVQYLSRLEVANIKWKVSGAMNAHLIGDIDLEADILDSTKSLTDKNYQVERFHTQASGSQGVLENCNFTFYFMACTFTYK